MSDVGLTHCGEDVIGEEGKGNIDSLNSICLQVYRRLDGTSRHKNPLETLE